MRDLREEVPQVGVRRERERIELLRTGEGDRRDAIRSARPGSVPTPSVNGADPRNGLMAVHYRSAQACASRSSVAGPGGLYFAALAKQLGPDHDITVWERNAADDTFGFGVVFSDETLGGIEHADPADPRRDGARVRRWDDIDVHFRGRGA